VIVFGVDDQGKPKAARFAEKQAELATKAAAQLKLQVLAVTDSNIIELASRLPAGRIYSNGRGFVPYIRRELYEKLVAAASAGQPSNGHTRAPTDPAASADQSAKAKPVPSAPLNWDDIAPGHLVLVQDSLEEGWYDGIVVERTGDMLTVRWPDYPRERRATVHRYKVGLIYPSIQDLSGKPPSSTGPKHTGHAKEKAKPPETANQALPHTWEEIDVNHLVLARDDGPWKSWWEAIPIEKNGNLLTLRWRDHGKLPTIVRDRFRLALICPNPQ
jgi:hypothetical protein